MTSSHHPSPPGAADTPHTPPESAGARPAGRSAEARAAAVALAGGLTFALAAAAAACNERTVRRWWAKEPAFRRAVGRYRRRMTDEAVGRLTARLSAAADVLAGQLAHDDPDVAHRAAVKLIELYTRLHSQADLDRRLAALEAAAAAHPPAA